MRESEIAINRVSNWVSSAMDDPKWQGVAHKTFLGDLCMLVIIAKSAIADHPDDEDEPITREWLESIGFVLEGVNDPRESQQDFCLGGPVDSIRIIDLGGKNERMKVFCSHAIKPAVKTRGQLRQLIKLLKGPQP